nr:uncharacterized protein LOC112030643 [Quercus suber]
MVKVPVLVQAWTKCNNMVKNGVRLFQLQKELATISQGDLSITNHFTQLNVLWHEIENYRALPCCTCGSCTCSINEKLTQNQLQDSVMQFLMGLKESYSQIRGQILLIDPLPSINKVYSLLIQDESQGAIGHSTGAYVKSTALATKASGGSSYGGGNASGHVGKGNKNKGKERPICSHCGITGHVAEKCYKLHGYPPGYKGKGKYSKAIQVGGPDLGFMDSDAMPQQQLFSSQQAFPFTADQYQKILAMISSSSNAF